MNTKADIASLLAKYEHQRTQSEEFAAACKDRGNSYFRALGRVNTLNAVIHDLRMLSERLGAHELDPRFTPYLDGSPGSAARLTMTCGCPLEPHVMVKHERGCKRCEDQW